jgi:hypothetical protein
MENLKSMKRTIINNHPVPPNLPAQRCLIRAHKTQQEDLPDQIQGPVPTALIHIGPT